MVISTCLNLLLVYNKVRINLNSSAGLSDDLLIQSQGGLFSCNNKAFYLSLYLLYHRNMITILIMLFIH